MRYTEGRAWLSMCPRPLCEHPVIEAHVDGIVLRLSTKAIPLKDATILQKHATIVINVWKTPLQLMATAWFKEQGAVDKGHLYVQHICSARP